MRYFESEKFAEEKDIFESPELTGVDYIMTPLPTLVEHPDFNQEVMVDIFAIALMTTAQIESRVKIQYSGDES